MQRLLEFSVEQRWVPVPPLQHAALQGQQRHAGSGDLQLPAVTLVWAQTSLQARIVAGCSLHWLFTAGRLLSGLRLGLPQMWLRLPKHANIFTNAL